jgi:hypothetical protein
MLPFCRTPSTSTSSLRAAGVRLGAGPPPLIVLPPIVTEGLDTGSKLLDCLRARRCFRSPGHAAALDAQCCAVCCTVGLLFSPALVLIAILIAVGGAVGIGVLLCN